MRKYLYLVESGRYEDSENLCTRYFLSTESCGIDDPSRRASFREGTRKFSEVLKNEKWHIVTTKKVCDSHSIVVVAIGKYWQIVYLTKDKKNTRGRWKIDIMIVSKSFPEGCGYFKKR